MLSSAAAVRGRPGTARALALIWTMAWSAKLKLPASLVRCLAKVLWWARSRARGRQDDLQLQYLKKEMQQMEWNCSSCGVGIPLGRVTLVSYLLEQPYKNAPTNLVECFYSTPFVATLSLCTV